MSTDLRRKHSSIDLQQLVTRVDEYDRPLNSPARQKGQAVGLVHTAIVATTRNGDLYMIEKALDLNDDVNYEVRYREGMCRIVKITQKDIRNWRLLKSVTRVTSACTLEELFDSCGSGYSFLTDNCWNGAHRMRKSANPETEDGMAWQEKAGLGVLGGLAVAVVGVGIFAATRNKDSKQRMEQ